MLDAQKERPFGRSFCLGCLRNVLNGNDGAEFQSAGEVWHALFHECDHAFSNSVERVVLANANVLAGVNLGTALTNQDVSWTDLGAI